jgi:hypothetical protein
MKSTVTLIHSQSRVYTRGQKGIYLLAKFEIALPLTVIFFTSEKLLRLSITNFYVANIIFLLSLRSWNMETSVNCKNENCHLMISFLLSNPFQTLEYRFYKKLVICNHGENIFQYQGLIENLICDWKDLMKMWELCIFVIYARSKLTAAHISLPNYYYILGR